jgi:hypothetical protein
MISSYLFSEISKSIPTQSFIKMRKITGFVSYYLRELMLLTEFYTF